MAGKRHIASALHNFLGSYVSRYSSFEGYFLFGFIVADLDRLEIDLLLPGLSYASGSPLGMVEFLGKDQFARRMRKVGVPLTQVRCATLVLERAPTARPGRAGDIVCSGFAVRFVVTVETMAGKRFERDCGAFVAPHDKSREHRSGYC